MHKPSWSAFLTHKIQLFIWYLYSIKNDKSIQGRGKEGGMGRRGEERREGATIGNVKWINK